MLTLCSCLITVSEKGPIGQESSNIESLEVRLAHSSVKDYLVSRHIESGPFIRFALEAHLAHFVMAGCCLVYLLQFRHPLDVATVQRFPLGLYSAQFWPEHYRRADASDRELLDGLALQLLTDKVAYRNCHWLCDTNESWPDIDIQGSTGPPVLYYAALEGLCSMIMPLVANGADPNEDAVGCHFGEALGAAAYKGNKDCVQALLRAGAKPNGMPWEGEYGSPLASAASQGHSEIVALLLRAGADFDKRGFDGQGSALYYAVSHRHLETVHILVDAGADANACAGMSGVSYAISIAASRDDREIVCLLFPKVLDEVAGEALWEVADAGHRELFEILLQMPRAREMGLKYAARAGWNDLVQSMVNEGLRDTNDNGVGTTNAFSEAAVSGSLETMQILYENAAYHSVSASEYTQAVALAASRGYSLVVQYLLDRGANIESRMCQQALVQAAENGHLSTVQILLTAGVSPDSQYKSRLFYEEKSCLLTAVDEGHVNIARLLLAFGADPNAGCREESALNTTIGKDNEELFDLLIEHGASTAGVPIKVARYDTLALSVHYAASFGRPRILRKLLETGLGADDTFIPDGWTALFHAAKAGHEEILRTLINDYGADVNRRANKGTVAIHTAAYHNRDRCVEVFLDAGVDLNVRDHAGRTSLHWAAQEGSIDAVRVLLDKDANISIKEGRTSMTAADIAKKKALEVAESRKSIEHWRMPREENYEAIVEILVARASQ